MVKPSVSAGIIPARRRRRDSEFQPDQLFFFYACTRIKITIGLHDIFGNFDGRL
jgi:hypothetical protein